jgi:hypothetical protein
MVRDAPRTALPENAVYDSSDFLLHQPGLIQKRGGTAYASDALTAATYAHTVAHVVFSGNTQKLIAIGDNGHLYTISLTNKAVSDIATLGATYLPLDKPKLVFDKLILTGNDGATLARYFNTSSVDLATTPTLPSSIPAKGRFAEVWKSRLVLANTTDFPNRVSFSPTPDITAAWDTASYIDCDHAVTGLAATSNALVIFSRNATEKFVGSTVPATGSGSNISRTRVGSAGCTDARSICVDGDDILFASPQGVFATNGVGFTNLTYEGQIDSYWQTLFANYVRATSTIAAGLYRHFYFVTVMDGTTHVDTLMCDLPKRRWWRLTNTKARSYSTAYAVQQELFYADGATNRVLKLAGIFTPAAGNKNDADGTAVQPLIELRLVGPGPYLKHFRHARVSYDMRDAASDNPTLAVAVAPNVEATTYVALAESPLAETTDISRERVTVAQVSQAVNMKLTQTGASSKTEIYAVETETRPLTGVRGGQ